MDLCGPRWLMRNPHHLSLSGSQRSRYSKLSSSCFVLREALKLQEGCASFCSSTSLLLQPPILHHASKRKKAQRLPIVEMIFLQDFPLSAPQTDRNLSNC